MRRSLQNGSAHAIIIVLLIVALLGAVGFVFYQNFIQKPADTISVQPNEDRQSNEMKSRHVAFESKIYALDYPSNWTVADEAHNDDSSAVFYNADKTIRINFSVSRDSPVGSCDTAGPRKVRFYSVSDKAVTALN